MRPVFFLVSLCKFERWLCCLSEPQLFFAWQMGWADRWVRLARAGHILCKAQGFGSGRARAGVAQAISTARPAYLIILNIVIYSRWGVFFAT